MKAILCAGIAVCIACTTAGAQASQGSRGQAPSRANQQAPSGVPSEYEEYLIGPGDVLDIKVRNEPTFSKQVFVRMDGRITVAWSNDFMVAGKTIVQLGDLITQGLARFFQDEPPPVTIDLIESKKMVYIEGKGIRKSGAYPMTGPVNVMMLISMAEGLSEFAKSNNIKIMRTDGQVDQLIPFNYETYTNGSNLKQNIWLRPGDIINVP